MYYDHGIAFHTSSGTKTAGDILYDFGNPGLVSSGTAERMTITPDGNVGIGTSSPAQKLHVSQGTTGGHVRISGLSTDNLDIGTDGAGLYQEWNSDTQAKSQIRLQTRNSNVGVYSFLAIDGGISSLRV
jgi:hypothetical protein